MDEEDPFVMKLIYANIFCHHFSILFFVHLLFIPVNRPVIFLNGDACTGKTSLLNSLRGEPFREDVEDWDMVCFSFSPPLFE